MSPKKRKKLPRSSDALIQQLMEQMVIDRKAFEEKQQSLLNDRKEFHEKQEKLYAMIQKSQSVDLSEESDEDEVMKESSPESGGPSGDSPVFNEKQKRLVVTDSDVDYSAPSPPNEDVDRETVPPETKQSNSDSEVKSGGSEGGDDRNHSGDDCSGGGDDGPHSGDDDNHTGDDHSGGGDDDNNSGEDGNQSGGDDSEGVENHSDHDGDSKKIYQSDDDVDNSSYNEKVTATKHTVDTGDESEQSKYSSNYSSSSDDESKTEKATVSQPENKKNEESEPENNFSYSDISSDESIKEVPSDGKIKEKVEDLVKKSLEVAGLNFQSEHEYDYKRKRTESPETDGYISDVEDSEFEVDDVNLFDSEVQSLGRQFKPLSGSKEKPHSFHSLRLTTLSKLNKNQTGVDKNILLAIHSFLKEILSQLNNYQMLHLRSFNKQIEKQIKLTLDVLIHNFSTLELEPIDASDKNVPNILHATVSEYCGMKNKKPKPKPKTKPVSKKKRN